MGRRGCYGWILEAEVTGFVTELSTEEKRKWRMATRISAGIPGRAGGTIDSRAEPMRGRHGSRI